MLTSRFTDLNEPDLIGLRTLVKLRENWVGVTGLQEGVSAVAKEKKYPSGDALIYSL